MNKSNVFQPVFASLLTAIGVALFTFSFIIPLGGLPAIRIDFITIPILIGGFMLGKWYGILIGVMIDIIGFVLFGQGVYFVGFTLNFALVGFIAGYIPVIIKKMSYELNLSVMYSMISIAILAASFYIITTPALRLGTQNYEIDLSTRVLFVIAIITLFFVSTWFLYLLTKEYQMNRQELVTIVNTLLIAEIIVILLTPIWIIMLYDAPSYYIGVVSRIVRASFLFPIKVVVVLAILTTFKRQGMWTLEEVK
jgi:ECF transporter S component (folate family)